MADSNQLDETQDHDTDPRSSGDVAGAHPARIGGYRFETLLGKGGMD